MVRMKERKQYIVEFKYWVGRKVWWRNVVKAEMGCMWYFDHMCGFFPKFLSLKITLYGLFL
jgi:hypothetical protein